MGGAAESDDATIVARMRAAGALLVGKANMHEIGIGVTGINPHHGATRNPYDPARSPGGSSSGSAAAVAAGLVPIALGADGGGSIRIPASLCGVVGLKATWGRLSEHGVPPLCWSVAHVGPLAASVTDCALAYGVMAGPDPLDSGTGIQPAPHLDDLHNRDLSGLRVGLYRPWFEDADSAVVKACQEGLDALVAAGATLVDVEVEELSLIKTAHVITILGEMAASQHAHDKRRRARYGTETRLNLALASALGAHDYVAAQRHRTRICAQFSALYESIDVLVTPTCGRTAPPVPDDALATGLSNIPVTDQIMRFAPAANLTGLPAISLPVGYDEGGLPIGLQLMGRAWEEHTLLRMGGVVEAAVSRRPPRVLMEPLLGKAPGSP
jgi:Asp-tRNA(Asn)/Glu-tRNA(Gln) amidotransferase A subunit family amidase